MLCERRKWSASPDHASSQHRVLQHLNTGQPSGRQGRAGYQDRLRTLADKVMELLVTDAAGSS